MARLRETVTEKTTVKAAMEEMGFGHVYYESKQKRYFVC